MPLDISSSREWEQAETLLLNPTAANVESVAGLLRRLIEHSQEIVRQGDSVSLPKPALSRLRQLLDQALHLRLGVARILAAGQAGYSADGQEANAARNGQTVAVI